MGGEIQSPKTFFKFCGQQSFLLSMYGNQGAVISFMTMISNEIKCSSLADYPVYSIHTTRTSSPMNRVQGAIGGDYLQPRSDIKIPMGHLLRWTRVVHRCAAVGQLICLPPRSGPMDYSQLHRRKTSGDVQTNTGFPNTIQFQKSNLLTKLWSIWRKKGEVMKNNDLLKFWKLKVAIWFYTTIPWIIKRKSAFMSSCFKWCVLLVSVGHWSCLEPS